MANKAIRIHDPKAMLRCKLANPWCVACSDPGANAHHVLRTSGPHFGDDVFENLVTLCGSGTMRCHGAHHGNPYMVEVNDWSGDQESMAAHHSERRDAEWVNRRIGKHLLEHRWDVIDYMIRKLGKVPGEAYLERVYFVTV